MQPNLKTFLVIAVMVVVALFAGLLYYLIYLNSGNQLFAVIFGAVVLVFGGYAAVSESIHCRFAMRDTEYRSEVGHLREVLAMFGVAAELHQRIQEEHRAGVAHGGLSDPRRCRQQ